MIVPGFLLKTYAPLGLPKPLSDIPQDYLKLLPMFNGGDDTSVPSHIEAFFAFAQNLNVEHLDVVLRLFVQSLDGEIRKWFNSLLDASITTWEEMVNSFMEKRG